MAMYFILRGLLRQRWFVIGPAMGIVTIAMAAALILLRPGAGTVSDVDSALAMLDNGRPTFVEFFSNYCSGCLALNPIVNEIIREIEDEYDILQIDIHSSVGRVLRERLDFTFTPEFVLYDPHGIEVWRDHIPPNGAQLERARDLN